MNTPPQNPSNEVTLDIDQNTAPSTAAVMAVAELLDEDPLELPCLYETIDPDAIDTLVGSRESDVTLSFELGEASVTINNSDSVTATRQIEEKPFAIEHADD